MCLKMNNKNESQKSYIYWYRASRYVAVKRRKDEHRHYQR